MMQSFHNTSSTLGEHIYDLVCGSLCQSHPSNDLAQSASPRSPMDRIVACLRTLRTKPRTSCRMIRYRWTYISLILLRLTLVWPNELLSFSAYPVLRTEPP